jgi:hypothetical protein
VSVDGKIGAGKVRITLSFDDWKEGNVAPATYEIDQPPPPKEEKRRPDDPGRRLPPGTVIGA